ncbi:MAG: hypothetical protein C4570_08860 [Ammonifex sp.]|nr:MAG: hypothetical protein C4570_08860 [Ammonifex sp.]
MSRNRLKPFRKQNRSGLERRYALFHCIPLRFGLPGMELKLLYFFVKRPVFPALRKKQDPASLSAGPF